MRVHPWWVRPDSYWGSPGLDSPRRAPRLVAESKVSSLVQPGDSEPYAGRASHMDRTQVECLTSQTAEGLGIRAL